MENLLAVSFDCLSSASATKVRRGLKQLSGLISQLCLSTDTPARPQPRPLSSLAQDPAFRAFSRLQDNFQYNVPTHLVACLERLLGKGSSGETDLLIISCLELLVGCLLVHNPSRELWRREVNINLFLDLLEPSSCPAVQIATLNALTAALLDHPANMRVLERLDGLLVITSLFKSRQTSREVKKEIIEFYYFYLSAEGEDLEDSQHQPSIQAETLLGNNKEEVLSAFRRASKEQSGSQPAGGALFPEVATEGVTKSKTEKQHFLSRYLDNVGDLVQDMKETTSVADGSRSTSVVMV